MFKFIAPTDAIIREFLNVLVYGEPGLGKTSLSFTCKKPLHLNFDKNGLSRACFRESVSVDIEKWEDVIALQNSKEFERFAPDTLICDTVGTMLDEFIADYVKRENPRNSKPGGDLSLPGFGAMRNVFYQFVSWAGAKKMHILFIAHATEERFQNNTKMVPKITGGSYDIIREKVDLIGYIESSNNKRIIDFAPKDAHIGKDCAEIGSLEIPDYRTPEYATFMSEMIDRTVIKMNSLSEKQAEIKERLNNLKEKLTGVDVKSYNDLMNVIIKNETDAGIKTQLWNIMLTSAKTAGFVYDATEKAFKNAKS